MFLTRDGVFDRIFVDFFNRGGARVSWTLHPQYAPPGPHTFRLQTGSTGAAEADDWADVGAPVTDQYFQVDPIERTRGMHPTVFYRVVLTDIAGTHVSRPVSVDGTLGARDWALARELVRKEMLVLRKFNGVHGWLLKRKRVGPLAITPDRASTAVDGWTGEVITRSPEAGAYGADRVGGYFAPIAFRAFFDPGGTNEEVVPGGEGNVDQAAMVNEGRVVLFPPVDTLDAFVEFESDYRYYIHLTRQLAHIRGVPIVADCKFYRAPVADPVYDVPTPTEWHEPNF